MLHTFTINKLNKPAWRDRTWATYNQHVCWSVYKLSLSLYTIKHCKSNQTFVEILKQCMFKIATCLQDLVAVIWV